MNFDLAFLQHIIAHGVIAIVFLIVGSSIIHRKKNRVAQTLASLFFFVGIGLGTCVIIRTSSNPKISAFGSNIGYIVVISGLINLLFFEILILKSSTQITWVKQFFFTILYWIALIPIFIPNNWAHVWIEYPEGSIPNSSSNLTTSIVQSCISHLIPIF